MSDWSHAPEGIKAVIVRDPTVFGFQRLDLETDDELFARVMDNLLKTPIDVYGELHGE